VRRAYGAGLGERTFSLDGAMGEFAELAHATGRRVRDLPITRDKLI
jgi:hypothetical protein